MASVSRLSQSETASRLGLTTRQIHNLRAMGMPSESVEGKVVYLWPAALHWYIEHRIKAAEPKDFEEARARKMAAEARLAELEQARMEGRSIDVEESARVVDAMLTQLRGQLITLPQRWAPALVGLGTLPKVQAVLEQAVEETLGALSK